MFRSRGNRADSHGKCQGVLREDGKVLKIPKKHKKFKKFKKMQKLMCHLIRGEGKYHKKAHSHGESNILWLILWEFVG